VSDTALGGARDLVIAFRLSFDMSLVGSLSLSLSFSLLLPFLLSQFRPCSEHRCLSL
jgi:hypothetical protein